MPEVAEEINSCFTRYYGNASELHRPGREAADILERSRQTVADILGARPREIVFTSGVPKVIIWLLLVSLKHILKKVII